MIHKQYYLVTNKDPATSSKQFGKLYVYDSLSKARLFSQEYYVPFIFSLFSDDEPVPYNDRFVITSFHSVEKLQ